MLYYVVICKKTIDFLSATPPAVKQMFNKG